MTKPLQFFATTPKGLELLLVDELRELGALSPAEKLAGVTFTGDLAVAYKACLWSRLANRILLRLTALPADSPEKLYAAVKTIVWDEHIHEQGTLAVDCVISQSTITHSLFAAQTIKDAIVDQFRAKYGIRPSIDKDKPQVRVNVYLHRDVATISLDLSGSSLHKRGYRLKNVAASLKENLAAAILLRADWPNIAQKKGCLLDPMCGSGTLLIEAALLAGDIAPGLLRDYFGFIGWKKHDARLYESLLQEAQVRREQGLNSLPTIVGYDHDREAIKAAFENIERAGLTGCVHVEKRELSAFVPKATAAAGLVVVNPPYGERLSDADSLQPLYTLLGDRLKAAFTGFKAAVFTGNPELGKQMGLRAKRYYALFNGAIPCKLLLFDVESAYFVERGIEADNVRRIHAAKRLVAPELSLAVQMFVNRLRKNLKHLRRKAIRENLTSFRVYDADLPDYAFAIDLSETGATVKEYKAPKLIDEEKVKRRREEVLAVLPEILDLPARLISYQLLPRD